MAVLTIVRGLEFVVMAVHLQTFKQTVHTYIHTYSNNNYSKLTIKIQQMIDRWVQWGSMPSQISLDIMFFQKNMANKSKHPKPLVVLKQIDVQSSILPQSSTTSNLTKGSQVGAVSWDNKRNKPIKKTELFINECKFAHFIFSVSTLKPRFLISHYFSVILTSGPVWYCGVRGREAGREREARA